MPHGSGLGISDHSPGELFTYLVIGRVEVHAVPTAERIAIKDCYGDHQGRLTMGSRCSREYHLHKACQEDKAYHLAPILGHLCRLQNSSPSNGMRVQCIRQSYGRCLYYVPWHSLQSCGNPAAIFRIASHLYVKVLTFWKATTFCWSIGTK